MATVKVFEDLNVWQRARVFSANVYRLTMNGSFSKDWGLKDQINRSTGSVVDNIAEGFERGGNREFIAFLSYAKSSAGESRSQLYRALDREHISGSTFRELKRESCEISKMISGFLNYLKRSPLKGTKFQGSVETYGDHGNL